MTSSAFTQTWFLGKSVLGASPIGLENTHGQLHAPRSYAFACPHCGEVWMRRFISPSTRWFFWTVPCSGCAGVNDNCLAVPGSIYGALDSWQQDALPLFMLKYETEVICKLGPINF